MDLFKGSARWRIGDGHLVYVRLNPWLPTPTPSIFRSVSLLDDKACGLYACHFFNLNGCSWNVDLLGSVFLP